MLDERVIDTRDLDTEYEIQYLPETRTMLPPPSIEYVEVCDWLILLLLLPKK